MNPPRIQLEGLLGDALEASRAGRLRHFIVDASSPAIALFGADAKRRNEEGDWYGEHAGKWLSAAAKAAARTQDDALAANVRCVADFLVATQEPDGYLGTYAPSHRFMVKQPAKPGSWDGAPSQRTWDIWVHSYLILGLLEAHRLLAEPRYLQAACRIGDLCWRTLSEAGIDITELGNHFGLSATVLMDPALELHAATGEQRYLDLAVLIAGQADRASDLALVTRASAGRDASEIATGKAYQLLWNLVGLAKLHRATGNLAYRQAVDRLWQSVRDRHLTLGGGPWGGVGLRSREVFNPPGIFSPEGYVETCSTLAWIELNRVLLEIDGDARYAEEIERAAYNDLLGAMAPNGADWCYYSFPNGRRVHTTYWRCCKSSGAMALEVLPGSAYGLDANDTISVHLLGPGRAGFDLVSAGTVELAQITAYPFDGSIRIRIRAERPARFAVRVRIPSWADGAKVVVGGIEQESSLAVGTYAVFEREWQLEDEIALILPMRVEVHRQTNRNIQVSRAPDGAPVEQEVLRDDYIAVSRGPLVYATGLIDGFKSWETILMPTGPVESWLELLPASADGCRAIRMKPASRQALDFVPYYRAGGRADGAWRVTWLRLDSESPKSSSRKNL
jgi:DUF1680 family protein